MKPQIVMQGSEGFHNADLSATRQRLLKEGAWKNQRIVVIIPAGDSVPTKVYLNHMALGFPPNNGVFRMGAIGLEVGAAYSNAIEQVLGHPELSKWEYILTIEHDNCAPPDGVLKLCAQMELHPEYACIGGLYFTKGPGGVAQIWGNPSSLPMNFRPQPPSADGGLVECNGTGMGFNLWRMEMFKDKHLPHPLFKTQIEGGLSTQDLYFWRHARALGYRCAVDCSVRVGHYDLEGKFGQPDMMW